VQPAEARNFGRPAVDPHAVRYERAGEFVRIVTGLWDSWEDDAFLRDAESGLFFDPDKLHALDYKGKYYSVAGPLNAPRPVQGWPVIVQAGASPEGKEIAAEFAEAIFSPHLTFEEAKAYYDDVKGRMRQYGRDPDHLKILPGLSVVVAPTDAEAIADFEYLQSLVHPIVGREILSTMLGGIDLSPYPLDGPLPDLPPSPSGSRGHYDGIVAKAKREKLTIRQLGAWCAGARGKNAIHGSVQRVADYMEEWFVKGACDGFCVMPPYIPGAHDDFCNLVIPELQRRGLFRTQYEGTTLRENLGLPRPESPYRRN
jgi:alkanesulfonate monooxygenase